MPPCSLAGKQKEETLMNKTNFEPLKPAMLEESCLSSTQKPLNDSRSAETEEFLQLIEGLKGLANFIAKSKIIDRAPIIH